MKQLKSSTFRVPHKSVGHSLGLAVAVLVSCLFGLRSAERQLTVPLAVDFASDIRPILENHCYDCHDEEKQKGSLQLDNVTGILKGGDSGEPVFVRGKSGESSIIKHVTSENPKERMPPKGDRLSTRQIGLLRAWIDSGAKMPGEAEAAEFLKIKTDHWSFQPVKRPDVPKSGDVYVKNEVDEFVLISLKDKGLTPSTLADRATLIRRLYLVMHGMPPAPEELAAFIKDENPDAYARLVDVVLASPRYGERWARHWMDVVRYADTNGFETNRPRPHAWHYRDWIINALNADKPYDQFIREQLAGDALGEDAATGFLVAGTYDIVKGDPLLNATQRENELTDMVNTTSTAFMGLTMGCARCHNHKFDPILQKDYFAMQAVFAGVTHGERQVRKKLDISKAKDLENAKAIEIASNGLLTVWAGQFSQPGPTYRLYRGEPMQNREVVAPDSLTVLGTLGMAVDEPEQERRLKIANWIASPQHPLTARVMVNRLWHYIFGTGIVDTPSDFGKNGSLPTHPELLDWLADEFVRNGWSVKHMQRILLLSATFQQSSTPRTDALQADAGGRILWRYTPRRMEAEAIRDSMLAVSGAMDLKMGGPGFSLMDIVEENVMHYFPKEKFTPVEFRRMVYQFRIRQTTDSVFSSLDCPDGGQVMAKRSRSNTPLQALNLFNSTFVLQQAEFFSSRLQNEAGDSPEAQVVQAFALCYAREPDAWELEQCAAMIRELGLPAFARALYNSSEFLFVF